MPKQPRETGGGVGAAGMGCADGVGTSSGNLPGLLEFGRAFAMDTRGFCPITILRPISGDVEGGRGKAVLRKGGKVSLPLGCGDGGEVRSVRGSKVAAGWGEGWEGGQQRLDIFAGYPSAHPFLAVSVDVGADG